ncbi:hypothetical protein VP01_344g3 [Puccinia sorghi]|uniref:Uncharacterized protein n=1 Tax=Puccinia sorghi TaxID=27349 RepID=A0A0L6UW99_9BASI|nr:hypothetical protein VP01_344g3 [Puccinia sorghi]
MSLMLMLSSEKKPVALLFPSLSFSSFFFLLKHTHTHTKVFILSFSIPLFSDSLTLFTVCFFFFMMIRLIYNHSLVRHLSFCLFIVYIYPFQSLSIARYGLHIYISAHHESLFLFTHVSLWILCVLMYVCMCVDEREEVCSRSMDSIIIISLDVSGQVMVMYREQKCQWGDSCIGHSVYPLSLNLKPQKIESCLSLITLAQVGTFERGGMSLKKKKNSDAHCLAPLSLLQEQYTCHSIITAKTLCWTLKASIFSAIILLIISRRSRISKGLHDIQLGIYKATFCCRIQNQIIVSLKKKKKKKWWYLMNEGRDINDVVEKSSVLYFINLSRDVVFQKIHCSYVMKALFQPINSPGWNARPRGFLSYGFVKNKEIQTRTYIYILIKNDKEKKKEMRFFMFFFFFFLSGVVCGLKISKSFSFNTCYIWRWFKWLSLDASTPLFQFEVLIRELIPEKGRPFPAYKCRQSFSDIHHNGHEQTLTPIKSMSLRLQTLEILLFFLFILVSVSFLKHVTHSYLCLFPQTCHSFIFRPLLCSTCLISLLTTTTWSFVLYRHLSVFYIFIKNTFSSSSAKKINTNNSVGLAFLQLKKWNTFFLLFQVPSGVWMNTETPQQRINSHPFPLLLPGRPLGTFIYFESLKQGIITSGSSINAHPHQKALKNEKCLPKICSNISYIAQLHQVTLKSCRIFLYFFTTKNCTLYLSYQYLTIRFNVPLNTPEEYLKTYEPSEFLGFSPSQTANQKCTTKLILLYRANKFIKPIKHYIILLILHFSKVLKRSNLVKFFFNVKICHIDIIQTKLLKNQIKTNVLLSFCQLCLMKAEVTICYQVYNYYTIKVAPWVLVWVWMPSQSPHQKPPGWNTRWEEVFIRFENKKLLQICMFCHNQLILMLMRKIKISSQNPNCYQDHLNFRISFGFGFTLKRLKTPKNSSNGSTRNFLKHLKKMHFFNKPKDFPQHCISFLSPFIPSASLSRSKYLNFILMDFNSSWKLTLIFQWSIKPRKHTGQKFVTCYMKYSNTITSSTSAKFGLEFLGGINNKDDDGKEILIGETYPKEAAKAVMKISSLTNITNTSIKLKTILERIHTIRNYQGPSSFAWRLMYQLDGIQKFSCLINQLNCASHVLTSVKKIWTPNLTFYPTPSRIKRQILWSYQSLSEKPLTCYMHQHISLEMWHFPYSSTVEKFSKHLSWSLQKRKAYLTSVERETVPIGEFLS